MGSRAIVSLVALHLTNLNHFVGWFPLSAVVAVVGLLSSIYARRCLGKGWNREVWGGFVDRSSKLPNILRLELGLDQLLYQCASLGELHAAVVT